MTLPKPSGNTIAMGIVALLISAFSWASSPLPQDASAIASGPEVALKLQEHQLKQSDDWWSIEIKYPHIERLEAFNTIIRQHVTKVANDFRNGLPITAPKEYPNYVAYLKGDFKAQTLKNGIISVLFSYDEYTPGAAHPWGVLASIAYDTRQNRVLALADLFCPDSNYLSQLSKIAIQELDKREYADKEEIRRGAAPSGHNFAVFTLTESELVLHFQQYQVAAGAAGEPEPIAIPLTTLAPLLCERYRAALK